MAADERVLKRFLYARMYDAAKVKAVRERAQAAVRLALAITIQGIWLSNPHSAAVMSRGFVQCASFRQPQSPAQLADGLLSDGRGPGLAIAQEAALKFKETCAIQAEAFSGAEVKHGPMALVDEVRRASSSPRGVRA